MGRPIIPVEAIKERFAERHIEVIGDYKNTQTPVLCRCMVCSHEWSPIPSSVISVGQGCPSCKIKKQTTPIEVVKEKFEERHIALLGAYKNLETPVLCQCMVCSHEWSTRPTNVVHNGSGCPACALKNKSTPILVVKEKLEGRSVELIGPYKNIYTPTLFRCTVCFHEWNTRLGTVVHGGAGCPACARKKQTTPVETVKEKLGQRGIKLIGLYKNLLTPALCQCMVCSHEWSTRASDIIYGGSGCPACARERNAAAKTTPEKVVKEKLNAVGIDLIGPYKNTHMKALCRCVVCSHEWSPYLHSIINGGSGCPACSRENQRTPIETVKEELRQCGVTLLGQYKGRHTPALCQCMVCSHRWKPNPSNVINNGSGCPVCALENKITPMETVKEELLQRGIALVGPYKTLGISALCRCMSCSHEWSPLPKSIIHGGSGCPVCALKKQTTPIEVVKEKLWQRRIELIGPYKNMNTPVLCRCMVCSHEWKPNPSNVINTGHGCPACWRDPWQKQGIYILQHPDIETQYVGISWRPTIRIIAHKERDDIVGEIARAIDKPYELTFAEVHSKLYVGWEEDNLPEYAQNWFLQNQHGKLPPGRLWFTKWNRLSSDQWNAPARVPRFVAQWIEVQTIRDLSIDYASDCPFTTAGKVPLANKTVNWRQF